MELFQNIPEYNLVAKLEVRKGSKMAAGESAIRYLMVRWRSVLNVELQSPQRLLLLDEVCCVQCDVLMEDLKVLTNNKQE